MFLRYSRLSTFNSPSILLIDILLGLMFLGVVPSAAFAGEQIVGLPTPGLPSPVLLWVAKIVLTGGLVLISVWLMAHIFTPKRDMNYCHRTDSITQNSFSGNGRDRHYAPQCCGFAPSGNGTMAQPCPNPYGWGAPLQMMPQQVMMLPPNFWACPVPMMPSSPSTDQPQRGGKPARRAMRQQAASPARPTSPSRPARQDGGASSQESPRSAKTKRSTTGTSEPRAYQYQPAGITPLDTKSPLAKHGFEIARPPASSPATEFSPGTAKTARDTDFNDDKGLVASILRENIQLLQTSDRATP